MITCFRAALVGVLVSLVVHDVQANGDLNDCGDGECNYNVQLLQQDMNLKAQAVLNERSDANFTDFFDFAQQAFSQLNDMMTEGRAPGEIRLADRAPGKQHQKANDIVTKVTNSTHFAEQAQLAFSQLNDTMTEGRAAGETRLADRMGMANKLPEKKVANLSKEGKQRQTASDPVTQDLNSTDLVEQADLALSQLNDMMTEGRAAGEIRLADRMGKAKSLPGENIAALSQDANYSYLVAEEKNLIGMLHAQAIVVSQATDTYKQAQLVDDTSTATSEKLEDDLDAAERNEDIANGAHVSVSSLIAAKKAQLAALQEAVDEANETHQIVKPKYLAAEAAYQASLQVTPAVKNNTANAEKDYKVAQAALDAAESTQRAADLAVENQTMELQNEIKELNELNEELRDVQAELDRPLPPST